MATNTPVITVDNVSKDFVLPHEKTNSIKGLITGLTKPRGGKDVQHALKDVSFEVNKGEFFGIVGRNGSGKSTLLKMLAGIYQPNVGTVRTRGRLVPFIELGVGFNPELSGRENIYLNGALFGFSRSEIDAMYEDIVSFAELERFMDQKLKNYSSGMQVRLAFSMAVRAEADILLIDEVLAVGDADFQRKCFEYFRELKKQKKTVVFVSHDMNAVREYCDRAVLIDSSRLIASGSAEEIAEDYTKLFSETDVEQPQTSQKWGVGGVEIEKVVTDKNAYTPEDEYIEISVTIKSLQDFQDDLVTGIAIKNEAGDVICGTNSRIIKGTGLRPKRDTTHIQTWRVPNIFSDGKLTVEPSVVNNDYVTVHQWWKDAKTFRVKNDQKTPYPVSPKITIKTTQG